MKLNLWKRIRQLSIGNLFRLGWFFIKHPRTIVPYYRATKRTMELSTALFGSAHHGKGKANAFRHILWNWLLCLISNEKLKNDKKSVVLTQNFTNLYEKVTKNVILDQKMDLHNNAIGRNQFLLENEQNEQKIVQIVLNMVENSQKIDEIDDFQAHQGVAVVLTQNDQDV